MMAILLMMIEFLLFFANTKILDYLIFDRYQLLKEINYAEERKSG